MGEILSFKTATRIGRVPSSNRHVRTVWLRVTKRTLAEVTRHQVQYAIICGRGFPALKGWTNAKARSGTWFKVRVRTALLDRFLLDLELVMTARSLEVWVGDHKVKIVA